MKLFLIGGFLGSGKTTAIQQASSLFLARQTKVGVITNDQGVQLVDSKFIQSFNIPSKEVTSGCFCCNYDDLEESIQSLVEEGNPDIIFAESVGSCTDLVATVVNPLEKFYPDRNVLVTIFADARILPALIKQASHFFDDDVHYIYKKQLEEADIMVVNKIDLLSETELSEVKQIVETRYPDKEILYQNSLSLSDITKWILTLKNFYTQQKRKTLEIDYDIYSQGEANLGWVDGELEIKTKDKNAISIGYELINKIFTMIRDKGFPIGHLKFLMRDQDEKWHRKISFTLSDQIKAESEQDELKTNYVSLLINARVQAKHIYLKRTVISCIKTIENRMNAIITIKELSSFRPGYPVPTHKISS